MENEKTLVEKIAETVATFEIEKIKWYLWQLCYNPIEFLEDFGYTSKIDPVELQKTIVIKAQENIKGFSFGIEDGNEHSYGKWIKLKDKNRRDNGEIVNPILRDTLTERCKSLDKDPIELKECISQMCTKPKNFGYEYRRREAFKKLNFSEEEQKYLEEEIDTYCIGEILKEIQKESFPRFVPEKKGVSVKLDTTKLLEYQELVKEFFLSVTKLEEAGIDPEKVVAKKKEVESFYLLAANFA